MKGSVPTSKKTQNVSVTKISWLILYREMIAVYTEKNGKHIDTTNMCPGCGFAE
jgi:hypothetical protein